MRPRMYALFLFVLVVLGAVVYFTYPDKKLGGPSDSAQVEGLAEGLIAAVLQGDMEALEKILHKDFVFDRLDTVMTRSQFTQDIAKGDLRARLSDQRELEISGDAAFLTTSFDADMVIDDELLKVSGTMTIDFIKQGKTWSVRSIRIMPLS